MANLDSRSKRASSVGILLVSILAPPLPDGDISTQADKQHVAWSYSGINAETATVATTYRSERWRVYVPSHDDAVAVFLPAAAPVIRVYVPDHDDAWEVTIP